MVTVPNCYTTTGAPATTELAINVIKPPIPEGVQQPTPAQAAKNVAAAIAQLTPQAGVL